jgi:phosphatidylserine/phosphatidylglycerophosphate/cardiolipin synthase-like enzyme
MMFLLLVSAAFSLSLTDDPNYSHEVLFTNPLCQDYVYEEKVRANDGSLLEGKPKNAYCTRADSGPSGARRNSPQQRLVDWIEDEETQEIFLAFLSFSDRRVLNALCEAIEDRGVKVTMILDAATDTAAADDLAKCKGDVTIHYRGGVSGIDLAHIKLVITNPNDEDGAHKLAFASANLTSGTVLHHENWNFLTLSNDTYFMQAHLCAMNGMLDHADSARTFRDHMRACRKEISAEQEEDAQVYFSPAEGRPAEQAMLDLMAEASHISIAAHRFSNKKMRDLLTTRLEEEGFSASLVVDDDIYWAGKGQVIGANTRQEATQISDLVDLGLEIQYVETNHYEKLLHHNKYMIFDNDAVFTGAGNLTAAAFTRNFENFYVFTIPQVVQKYKRQYSYVWGELSTSTEKMPTRIVKPEPVE